MATPAESLGGTISTDEIVDATLQNLFDNVSASESAAGDVEYRCVYVRNSNLTDTLSTAKIWIQTNTPNAQTTVAIGLGTSAINGVEQTIANENTAPVGITFSSAINEANALSIGNLPPGQHKAIWVRRTINAGNPAYANDNFVLRINGDSPD